MPPTTTGSIRAMVTLATLALAGCWPTPEARHTVVSLPDEPTPGCPLHASGDDLPASLREPPRVLGVVNLRLGDRLTYGHADLALRYDLMSVGPGRERRLVWELEVDDCSRFAGTDCHLEPFVEGDVDLRIARHRVRGRPHRDADRMSLRIERMGCAKRAVVTLPPVGQPLDVWLSTDAYAELAMNEPSPEQTELAILSLSPTSLYVWTPRGVRDLQLALPRQPADVGPITLTVREVVAGIDPAGYARAHALVRIERRARD